MDGRVAQVKRPGKVKGVAELQLAFDQIRSPDHRTATLRAELLEITPMGGEDTEVDSEGGVKGRDSTKDDAAKVGAASGVGAIIGAIAGGGKGAAIGNHRRRRGSCRSDDSARQRHSSRPRSAIEDSHVD